MISVGADNTFGHPSPEVVERLIDRVGEDNVYRKDKDGTVELITDGERLWVKADSQEIYSVVRRLQWQASCRRRTLYGVAHGPSPTEVHLLTLPYEAIIKPTG